MPMLSKVGVCLIVKNEARYMVEWIAHYTALGFDEIMVYDNASTDATRGVVASIAKCNPGLALHDWPDIEGEVPQTGAYNDAIARSGCEWLAFFDADELLVLKQHDSIHGFLDEFPANAGGVAINWKLFGSSGHRTYVDELQSVRFRMCARDVPTTKNRFVKSIVRVRAARRMLSHVAALEPGFDYYDELARPVAILDNAKTATPSHEHAQLNHYVVRSRQEFEEKQARGNVARASDAPDKFGRDEEFWRTHDTNHVRDSSIDPWIDRAAPIRSRLLSCLEEDGIRDIGR